MTRVVNVKVLRRIPEENKRFHQTYKVPKEDGMSVMDVLKYIQDNIDSSLTFYCSCKVGLCLACTVRVNGRSALACATPVRKTDLLIEPLKDNTIRDLI